MQNNILSSGNFFMCELEKLDSCTYRVEPKNDGMEL